MKKGLSTFVSLSFPITAVPFIYYYIARRKPSSKSFSSVESFPDAKDDTIKNFFQGSYQSCIRRSMFYFDLKHTAGVSGILFTWAPPRDKITSFTTMALQHC
jgi:hypothetical protein